MTTTPAVTRDRAAVDALFAGDEKALAVLDRAW